MWADTTGQFLPKNKRKTTGLSRLAQKYSHPIGTIDSTSHRVLKNTGKSGLTPVTFPLPPQISQNELTNYQKWRYYGFSAAELEQLEAMAGLENRDLRGRLNNPIHPMYERTQWETKAQMPKHRGAIPIRGDEIGYWLAENPVVWKILEPSLRLASMLLTNSNYYPWWDALFNGHYKDIPPYRIPPEHTNKVLMSFHQRAPEVRNTPAAIALLQSKLTNAACGIKFRLFSGYCNTGLPVKEIYSYAEMNNEIWGGVDGIWRINIAIEILQPLLRNDLTDAERIAGQFRVAATLVHETAHAVFGTIRPGLKPQVNGEPYFEDEVLCELGWSLEDKLWGGEPLDIVPQHYSRGGPGIPHMGTFKTNWFTDRHTDYGRGRIPLLEYVQPIPYNQIDPYYCFDYWPVPNSWALSMFQPSIWNTTLRKFGAKATEMGPVSVGTRRFADDPVDAGYTILVGDTQQIMFDQYIWMNMTAEDQSFIRVENARRARTVQIYMSMMLPLGSASSANPQLVKDKSDEKEEEQIFECPRWDEITQYLFANRGPSALALDTMTFDTPEPSLYRYIVDRGGLDITPTEFRQFLLYANNKKQLFSYEPFPAIGTIFRLPTGWPPSTLKPIKRLAPPHSIDLANFRTAMNDPLVQIRIYAEFGEFRDVDYETLRRVLNVLVPPDKGIVAAEIRFIINECARNDQFVTLGPKGIARMTYEITDQFRQEWEREFTTQKLERNADAVKAAKEEERKKQEAEAKLLEEDLKDGSGIDPETMNIDPEDLEVEDDVDMS